MIGKPMAALMLTAALLLASCATGPGSKETAAPSASKDAPAAKTDASKEPTGTSADRTSSSSGGERAANFATTTLDGERFELVDKRGEVVALYFMAGWCASCIPEAQAWS